MAKLSARERAKLPDSAFAYIGPDGKRSLPIHDEAHVRNALARFGRVAFEDDAARERARKRLLNAAKKHGIVPVGFITGQLVSERRRAQAADTSTLPSGFVTFLLTDIEGSTSLLRRLGDRYPPVLEGVRSLIRSAIARAGGREVDARADEYFAVFEAPGAAVRAAIALQRELGRRRWPDDLECRVRAGIHSGRPMLTSTGYVGLSVHTVARISNAAHGGQVLVSGEARDALGTTLPSGATLRSLGRHRLSGLAQSEELFQVEAEGLPRDFPRLRTRSRRPAPAGPG